MTNEPLLTVTELARAVGRSSDSVRNVLDRLERRSPSKVHRDAYGRVRIRARLSDVMAVYRHELEDRGW